MMTTTLDDDEQDQWTSRQIFGMVLAFTVLFFCYVGWFYILIMHHFPTKRELRRRQVLQARLAQRERILYNTGLVVPKRPHAQHPDRHGVRTAWMPSNRPPSRVVPIG